MKQIKEKLFKLLKEDYVVLVFVFAFFSTAGSLFFQYVLNLPPCTLCIYQRFFMYPLLILSVLSILAKKKLSILLIFMMTIPGMLIAAYHVYIQSTGTENILGNCTTDVPCNVIDYQLGGVFTIPMLSLIAFASINVILIIAFILNRKEKVTKSIL